MTVGPSQFSALGTLQKGIDLSHIILSIPHFLRRSLDLGTNCLLLFLSLLQIIFSVALGPQAGLQGVLGSFILCHELGDEGLRPINNGLVNVGLLFQQPSLIGVEPGLLISEKLLLGLEGDNLGLGLFLGQMMAETAVGAIVGVVLEMLQFLLDGVEFAL